MPKLPSISPFMRVVLGLLLGSFAGLFFGEPLGRLEIFGDAYIRLLQMTVIPYVLVSLVGGLGGLDVEMARRIGTRGGGLILFVWATVLLSLVCVPLAYPNWTTASFFSTMCRRTCHAGTLRSVRSTMPTMVPAKSYSPSR